MSALYRLLPSMDRVLAHLEALPEPLDAPRALVREAVQAFLDATREEIRQGLIEREDALAWETLSRRIECFARSFVRPRFRRVLNATGVVVHTNLGRSVLADAATGAVALACRHYSNLEFDLSTGGRGSRHSLVEGLLTRLTGAESAMVVNNNAAAVLLVLESLCKGREVVVSRGQLVEIGGSFRVPEVMAKSGAVLREVGATNRTHLRDYEAAITPETAALLRVHTSNFRIIGFTKEVSLEELAALGARHGLPVIEDLGSGTLDDFGSAGLHGEPTVAQVVAAGADVVTFSGDKVLGGPQAGIIVGRKRYLDVLRRNQLGRALRIDKMTLAALEATLRLYLDPERARREIPTLAMIRATPQELKAKAQALARAVRRRAGGHFEACVRPGASRVGGGAFPERDLPTFLVCLSPKNPGLAPDTLRAALLDTDPPLTGRVEDGAFCMDPRTLRPDEFDLAARALALAAVQASL
ncbi:L-seryl-tRNA(Sec) selenium transferase [Fundidesulfovibrio magnetotacticus]|uniref:L-seryl-tRNA(Sec) selenium transferase n=1 Tax=Fundidesulfovibrio magnetotacticus TaxID=2730080 RepID=A0A6V8LT71_9BACT|nr:L-seryl-tRNA(Sec) selenium transferase [Fundidesulfovibrio magnetotacticus]GFK93518.1 L-seryl-tRNA(Sec) selenium transferase [Fundidesulfovibrio magnetotacticus]